MFSYARLATICAISGHSSLIRKVRKYSCLGTLTDRYHTKWHFPSSG
jgi:hypothetical protein